MFTVTLVLLFALANGSNITVQYYKELIANGNEKVLSYVPPQGNYEFQNGLKANTTKDFGIFDFIIIGAGSAGGVLTTRLSENDSVTILLLETGGEENDYSQIPAYSNQLHFDNKFNWGYFSTPQNYSCLGMKNRQCFVSKGKVIGGSSSINAMIYSRGNAQDYDNWAAMGNPGWSYNDVLPYFKKSENSQLNRTNQFHGNGGFWNIEHAYPTTQIYDVFLNACSSLRITIVDYHGPSQLGGSQVQFSTKRGRRESTGTAFLNNARKRNNVKVVTGALATKIIIKNKVAQGVEFVTKCQKFVARARKEVIVSAGVVNTPQLLMLSGIGPKTDLEKLGIEVIQDLPVGKNMQDQSEFPLMFETNLTTTNPSLDILIDEYLNGLGPLTKGSGIDGILFLTTPGSSLPKFEYFFGAPGNMNVTFDTYNYNETIIKMYQDLNPTSTVSVPVTLLHQKSKGEITLKSNSILDFPNVHLNYYKNQEDIEEMTKGIRLLLNLLETNAFKQINATLLRWPMCENFSFLSDAYWECLIRILAVNSHHQCGTTPMGPNSRTSVVNSKLQVHGLQKLRVVDTGIFPTSLSGHTNAPVVMVAEKISDDIKRDWQF